MSRRRSRSSTGRNPFDAYREIGFVFTVNHHILEGIELQSLPMRRFSVDWAGMLAGTQLPLLEIVYGLIESYGCSSAPAHEVLVGVTANAARFMRDRDAAPTFDETAEKLLELLKTLRSLGAVAQGRKRTDDIDPQPGWFERAPEDGDQGSRQTAPPHPPGSRILHPALQDQIVNALGTEIYKIQNDIERDLATAHLEKQERELLEFFDRVPDIMDQVEQAIPITRELSTRLPRERLKGAPSNQAADWAMIRLMWIWRDILGRDIKIYVKRIGDRAELEKPEPNECVAFVQEAMHRIDPDLLPVGLQNLERKLNALRHKVPRHAIAEGHSRNK